MKIINKILLSTVLVLSSMSFAQTTEVNQMTYKSKSSKFFDKIKPDRIGHFSIFAGPSLNFDRNPNEFDGTTDTGGITSWHQVSFQYQLNNNFRLVINPRFTVEYNQIEANGTNPVIAPDNPVVGIQGTFYKNGRFSWNGGVNTIFWVFDEGDREEQLTANPGGFQTLNYAVNSNFSMGTWVWARYLYYGNNTEDNGDVPLFTAPYASYNINDNNNIMAFYQIEGTFDSQRQRLDWDPSEHFNLMYSYTLSKNLTIQPIVTLFRETNFNISEGNLNLWLSGRFL